MVVVGAVSGAEMVEQQRFGSCGRRGRIRLSGLEAACGLRPVVALQRLEIPANIITPFDSHFGSRERQTIAAVCNYWNHSYKVRRRREGHHAGQAH